MRFVRNAAAVASVGVLAACGLFSSGQTHEARAATVKADGVYAYNTTNNLKLTFSRAKNVNSATAPTVVLIRGGFWINGDQTGFEPKADYLASKGINVFNVGYRNSTQAPWPAQRDDVFTAIQYVKNHASEYGVNGTRLGAVGYSAGGHIASLVGTYGAGSTRVKGVVSISGAVDPFRTWNMANADSKEVGFRSLADYSVLLFNCPPVRSNPACWNNWRLGHAWNYVDKTDAKYYAIHSVDDPTAPVEGERALVSKMKSVGINASIKEIPGSRHTLDGLDSTWDTTAAWIKANI